MTLWSFKCGNVSNVVMFYFVHFIFASLFTLHDAVAQALSRPITFILRYMER